MKTTDEELRIRFQDSTSPELRDGCLGREEMLESAEGRLSAERRAVLSDHLVDCSACAEEYRLLRAIHQEAVRAVAEPARQPDAGWWRPWCGWATASAVAAIAAAIVLPSLLSDAPPGAVFRSTDSAAIRSFVGDRLPRGRVILRWTPLRGARYRVTVATGDLRVLGIAGELTRAEYQVPAQTLVGIPAGGRFAWSVEAFLEDGRRVESPTFLTRLE